MVTSGINPIVSFDRRAWRQHRDRAARLGSVDFLHAEIAEQLLDRLTAIRRSFTTVLDLGAREGALAQMLASRPEIEHLVSAEPSIGFLARRAGLRVAADPELIPFRDTSFDLVISNLALHWAGDLPGALVQLRRILRPNGLLLAALFGGDTLVELRTVLIEAELAEEGGASPRVSPTVALADAASLLQRAGFAMPVADAEMLRVTYPDALALMRDLRGMGETNALGMRGRGPLKRATLARCAQIYRERFGSGDGRISASFEVLFLTGWTPHSSQPKPLRPGGAERRLAEALGTREIPAGDRATPRRDRE